MTTGIVISRKNTKIGKIASFSVPSITTCPGRTAWCSAKTDKSVKCYANRLEVQYPNVRNSYNANLVASKLSSFTRLMTQEIQKLHEYSSFRIHVAGDFYSVKYINKWIAIVKANPKMKFYAYTRSWRIPHLVPYLYKLSSLKNMSLLCSTDIDTFNACETVPKGFREAYAGDLAPANKKLTLCPVQAKKVNTCDACNLCISSKINTDIYFRTH